MVEADFYQSKKDFTLLQFNATLLLADTPLGVWEGLRIR